MNDFDATTVARCEQMAREIRVDCLRMGVRTGANGAHFGGGLSLAEIMAVLYGHVMTVDPGDPLNPRRDRMILSKGHGAMAYYSALRQVGFVSDEELLTFKSNDTFLYAHPSMNPARGIEFSSGSLGLGLSLGVGAAMGMRRRGNFSSRVFVVMGDGEIDEGSVWEALASAAHFRLGNVVAIVDQNGLQYDGQTDEILGMGDLEVKLRDFGWRTVTVDGHDVSALLPAMRFDDDQPTAIVARTVKGKGISFMENDPNWHHSRLSDEQYEQAMSELSEVTV